MNEVDLKPGTNKSTNSAKSPVLWFDDAEAIQKTVTGGKGANLAILAQGGFNVPPGFVLPTHAYGDFLEQSGVAVKIRAELENLDYDDMAAVEGVTQKIRALILGVEMPKSIAGKIAPAYDRLNAQYVAVRSSGAAEDLEDASFAGLHDTYLDISGVDEVVDAIKRCWASLWTSRATTYRKKRGIDHFESPMAVVIQKMVAAEIAGVMFTANPINADTDEFLINSSWGLGEAVVQGITNPDEYVVKKDRASYPDSRHWIPRGHLRLSRKHLGSKTRKIIRNPETGKGVVELDTPDAERQKFTLTDDQALELAAIGQKIQDHYNGFPQDMEFAIEDGIFYVLQARFITGVDFAWDADVNAAITEAGEQDDWVWSRQWADEGWTGACTALFYSCRAKTWSGGMRESCQQLGLNELAPSRMRFWKFHRGRVYFNAQIERKLVELTVPPVFRKELVQSLPPAWRQEVIDAPFNWLRCIKMWAQLHLVAPKHGITWPRHMHDYIDKHKEAYKGLTSEELEKLTYEQLQDYVDHYIRMEYEWFAYSWNGLLYIYRDVFSLLNLIINKWYKGKDTNIFHSILTGTTERTETAIENHILWQLQHEIRHSAALKDLFDKHPGPAFLKECEKLEEGRTWLEMYQAFVDEYGHRGSADRDIYYPRRGEDFNVDYRALKSMLNGAESPDPDLSEEKVNQIREDAIEALVADIRKRPFGGVKAEFTKLIIEYIHSILVARDNERAFTERSTGCMKKALLEINRRMREKGLMEDERDFYFLTREEIDEVYKGTAHMPLMRAKIKARKKDFDDNDSKAVSPPMFVQYGSPVQLSDSAGANEDGSFSGMPMSRGQIEGTARVIKTLDDIGRLHPGEILVTYSTDPGWTPVFLHISGAVVEVGGTLGHTALLAREYGFPAAQIEGAMSHIPDGARILLDGDQGRVVILDEVVDTE